MSRHDTLATFEAGANGSPTGPGRLERAAPLAGVLFAVAFGIGLLSSGDTPAVDAPGSEVIAHYEDSGPVFAGIAAAGLGAVLLVFFAGVLRDRLRQTGPEWLATVVFGGGGVCATGIGIFGMIQFALIDAAELGQPEVAQTLNIVDNDNFLPVIAGMAVMLLATGWHTLTSRALPTWLGWVSLVLGIVAVAGPAGFVAFMLFPVWVLVVAVVLFRQPAGS